MEAITHAILRPRRCALYRQLYDPATDLGPSLFHLQGVLCRRRDLEVPFRQVPTPRGPLLQCSWFEPFHRSAASKPPCVVYCHGNCGCRIDAFEIVEVVVTMGMSLFVFDFSGSGLSEGKYVSLGFFEKEDLSAVVGYLRKEESVEEIVVWGRSMGAAAAIMYAANDPSIEALVLDSPYTSLSEVIKTIIQSYKFLPSAFSWSILKTLKKRVKSLADFDIDSVCPISFISKCRMPCLFIHSVEDTVVNLTHSVRLFDQCPHLIKSIVKIPGGHDSKRPRWLTEEAAAFLHNSVSKRGRNIIAARTMFESRLTESRKSANSPVHTKCYRGKSALHTSLPASPMPSSPASALYRTTKGLFSSSRKRGSLLPPV